ncbi:MAG TPA: glycosyltransferase [Candidatus Paceibacterota bacterium]
MKLLIVTQTVDKNDAILGFFHRWIAEFAAKFEKVTVIALGVGSYDLPSNVTVLSLGKEKGTGRLGYIRNFYSYITSRKGDYDAVFVHMNPIYVVLGSPVWKILGKRIALWYVHKTVDLKLRLATMLADRVFTASKESFRIKSSKVVVTGHGIDLANSTLAKFPRDNSDAQVIATLGRVSATKNVDFMIRAFARAKREYGQPAVFEIIGNAATPADEEFKDRLTALVSELGISDSVVFKGQIANEAIPDYIGTVDLTLNASSTGSLDKAVLESMAVGVPVLCANEAFKDILGPFGLYCEGLDEDRFALMLSALLRGVPLDRKGLRAVIERDHSLANLIDRISKTI